MAYEFFHKQWICDFEDLTSNKESRNGMLEVTAEDTNYMQISFKSAYFQDKGGNYLFSPCELGSQTYDTDYFYEQTTYNAGQMYRWYMNDPKFIAFDTDNANYYQAFTGSQWSFSGWVNPDTDYNGWVNNITSTYEAGGALPESVNLYVFKIINLKMDESFSANARYIPLMYWGNDPNV